jgi:hypothetical protein
MELTLKKDRRNLQPIYELICELYRKGSLEDMKAQCREFVIEVRADKYKTYDFNQKINRIMDKTKLLQFITNVHMQDAKETATR